jgi:SAM-dependent methyltransferase
MPDAKRFWNDKILAWEDNRYGDRTGQGWLEWLAGKVSTSLRFRLDHAATQLEPQVRGRRVVELGCGSGLLARRLIAAGAESYQGIDIADRAIARARATHADLGGRVSFDVEAVDNLGPLGDAVVLSLGLFDWLDSPDIAHVFAIGRNGHYLHALSERRASVQQSLHRAYVHLSYGRRTGFAPRYHRLAEIERLLADQNLAPPQVIRHPRLRFGLFVSNLPGL